MSQWIGVVVLAIGALMAGVMFGGAPSPPPAVSFATASSTGDITVHITGAVVAPGLVVVEGGSRVADAVAAAGGLTVDASPAAVNLAVLLRDGMQVFVPAAGGATAAGDSGVVSMSSASVEELAALPGVGPVLAQRIVDHRAERGPFETMEDLLSVSGIGEAKLAAIRDVAVP